MITVTTLYEPPVADRFIGLTCSFTLTKMSLISVDPVLHFVYKEGERGTGSFSLMDGTHIMNLDIQVMVNGMVGKSSKGIYILCFIVGRKSSRFR